MNYKIDVVPTELSNARLWVANPKRRPYFAAAVGSLIPVQTELVKTLAVDAYWRLYFNPSYIKSLSVRQLGGALLHEIEHLLRSHHQRCAQGSYDSQQYNIAGDLEINDSLDEQEDVELPTGVLLPQRYGFTPHLLAEEYYELLEGNPDALQDASSSACGSCAHDRHDTWELPAPNADSSSEKPPNESGDGSCEGQKNVRGISDEQAKRIRRQVATDMLDHLARGGPGSVSDSLQRWAAELLEAPKIPWTNVLLGRVRTACAKRIGMVDYSYTRRNRRFADSMFILPAMTKPTPKVVIVIDTSGSMDELLLAAALTEVRGVLQATAGGMAVEVLSVDAAVHTVEQVFGVSQITLRGGGGTDMGVGVLRAAESRPRPDLIIVLTDGETYWPETKPKGCGEVIAVLLTESHFDTPNWLSTAEAF